MSAWRSPNESVVRSMQNTQPVVAIAAPGPGGRKIRAISGVIGALALSLSGSALAPVEAHAFAKAPAPIDPEPAVSAPLNGGTLPESHAGIERSGRYQEGYQYGSDSAGRIVDNVAAKTVGREGCGAIGSMENALVNVVRAIRPPRSSQSPSTGEDEFVRGYYRGYYDRVREGIRASREGCSAVQFETGILPGRLSGAFLCSSAELSLDWVLGDDFGMESVYQGWSGGQSDLSRECESHVEVELVNCSLGGMVDSLRVEIAASCR